MEEETCIAEWLIVAATQPYSVPGNFDAAIEKALAEAQDGYGITADQSRASKIPEWDQTCWLELEFESVSFLPKGVREYKFKACAWKEEPLEEE